MHEPINILALDLSLSCTGWCLDRFHHGVIKTGNHRGFYRVAMIVEHVLEMAQDRDLVVIEGYSFGSQGRSVFNIAELGGVVRQDLYNMGIPIVDVPPTVIKKYTTGKGNANKDEMIATAIRKFGFSGSDNNECDAFMLWALAKEASGTPLRTVPVVNKSAVSKVDWPDFVLDQAKALAEDVD